MAQRDASATTSAADNRSTRQNASSWSTVIGVWHANAREMVACATPTFPASSRCVIADSSMCATMIRATPRFNTPGTPETYRPSTDARSRTTTYPYLDHLHPYERSRPK